MGSRGSENFLTVVANNIDLLAGPVVGLVYPLHASIKAIESGSIADDQQWLTYWVLYSLIALFELTCAKLLESFPIWGYAKLFLTCWLVLPQFNGASYLYKNFIRPFYVNPYQNPTMWYFPNKRNAFQQPDDVLTAAERYMEENGTDAFQRLIAKAEHRGGKPKKSNFMGFDEYGGGKPKKSNFMGFDEYGGGNYSKKKNNYMGFDDRYEGFVDPTDQCCGMSYPLKPQPLKPQPLKPQSSRKDWWKAH